jgi:hypothetical protein
MDKSELNDNQNIEDLQSLYESIFSAGDLADANEKVQIKEPDLSIDDELIDILEQRKTHKDKLLKYLMWLTTSIFITFIIFLLVKIIFKIILSIDVVSDRLLEIFAISMFVEVIAVIRGITKALWDERGILSSPLISKMLGKK